MSYGNKKQCTASNGVRAKVIEPKRLLKRAADISAKTEMSDIPVCPENGGGMAVGRSFSICGGHIGC